MHSFDTKSNCFFQGFYSIGDNQFLSSLAQSSFVRTTTLGISFVAEHTRNFAGRIVSWILRCFNITQNVHDVAITILAAISNGIYGNEVLSDEDQVPDGSSAEETVNLNGASQRNDKKTTHERSANDTQSTNNDSEGIAASLDNQQRRPTRTLKQCRSLVFNTEKQMVFPIDIARIIFDLAKINLDNLALVSKNWAEMADDETLYRKTYPPSVNDTRAYEEILKKANPDIQTVDAGEELLLPRWIHRCLKDNEDELMVTLITDKVKIVKTNGEVIDINFDCLEAVGNFFKKPVTDLETCVKSHSWKEVLTEKWTPVKRHWSIIYKNSMHDNKEYSEQLALCENRIARLMDTTISMLMVYARSGCKERVFIWDNQNSEYNMVRFGGEDKTQGLSKSLAFSPWGILVFGCGDEALYAVGVALAR